MYPVRGSSFSPHLPKPCWCSCSSPQLLLPAAPWHPAVHRHSMAQSGAWAWAAKRGTGAQHDSSHGDAASRAGAGPASSPCMVCMVRRGILLFEHHLPGVAIWQVPIPKDPFFLFCPVPIGPCLRVISVGRGNIMNRPQSSSPGVTV